MSRKSLYIIGHYFKYFLIFSIAFLILFLTINILDSIIDYLKFKIEFEIRKHIYTLPLLFVQISPIATILSSMFILSEMLKTNELKVFYFSGITPYRIFIFFLLCGFFSSLISFFFKNFVSPPLIKKLPQKEYFQNSITFSSPDYFFFAEKVDKSHLNAIFYNLEFSQYFPDKNILTIKAKKAVLIDNNLWCYDGIFWKFNSKKELIDKEEFKIKRVETLLIPDILLYIGFFDVEKFSFWELLKITKEMKKLKIYPVTLITHIHEKFSYPLLNLFIVFLILPFLLTKEKISNIFIFSFCFLLSLSLYTIYAFFFSLSKNGKINPIFGVWFVPFLISLFTFLNISRLKGVKKFSNI